MDRLTARHPLSDSSMVAIVSSQGEPEVVRWYANVIGSRRNPRIHFIPDEANADTPAPLLGSTAGHRHSSRPVFEAVKAFARANAIGLLLADWNRNTVRLQALMQCAADLNIPAVFIRQSHLGGIRRILVATAGGLHTLQQMWVAREISATLNIPMHVVRLLRDEDHRDEPLFAAGRNRESAIENWTSRLLGVGTDTKVLVTTDLVQGITACLRAGDLLVMGAPSPFHTAGRFRESIPAIVAETVDAPLILMHSRRPETIALRNLFWGRLAQVGLRPPDKQAAITELVDALIRHNQAPRSSRADLVDRAMQRERLMSTAVDCETALPHIRLPGFRGVAGSMGICPDGVAFGSPDGSRSRFLYLLITPDGFCDEYLAILGKIARRMARPEVRKALLACTTHQDVLDVLEPRNEMHNVPS